MGIFGIRTKKRQTSAPLGNVSIQAIDEYEEINQEDLDSLDADGFSESSDLKNTSSDAVEKNESSTVQRRDRRFKIFKRKKHKKPNSTTPNNVWGKRKLNPVPPKVLYKTPKPNPIPLSEDQISLSKFSIVNDNIELASKTGISSYRPEIISLCDFNPVFDNNNLSLNDIKSDSNKTLELIQIEYQSSFLRQNILKSILQEMNESNYTKKDLKNIADSFNGKLNNIKNIIDFYTNLLQKVNVIKDALDVKNIPDTSYTNGYLTLKQFYEKYMQFSREEYDSFSETKIYNQFILDFRKVLENYSFSLLNITDPDRTNDFDPVIIDKSYAITNGFKFNPSSLQSPLNPQNASNNVFFSNFINSLPQNPDDKIKLLCNFISKELRVSKGLGRQDIQNILLNKFNQAGINNPFDNIFGDVGDSIFEQPLGNNSLSSLSYVLTNKNYVVLPYENIYIDSGKKINNLTYVPGTTYFGDGVLDYTNGSFNIDPFVSYADTVSDTVINTVNVLNKMFEYDNQKSKLTQTSIYDILLLSFKESMSNIVSSSKISKDQAFVAALFKLANTDTALKNNLFDFCLLSGLASSVSNNQKKIIERMTTDIPTINSLYSFKDKTEIIPLVGGIKNLKPYINELAEIIENRVFVLLYNITDVSLLKTKNTIQRKKVGDIFFNFSTKINKDIAEINSSINLLQNNISTIKDGYLLKLKYGDIKSTLTNLITANGVVITTLIKEFSDILVQLDEAASVGSNAVYLVDDQSYRTRNNFVSTSTIGLLVFELLSSFADKYCKSDFEKTTNKSEAFIRINANDNLSTIDFINTITEQKNNLASNVSISSVVNKKSKNKLLNIKKPHNSFINDSIFSFSKFGFLNGKQSKNIQTKIKNTITTTVSVENFYLTVQLLNLGTSLKSNRDKLNEEDVFVKNGINILSIINNRITNAKTQVVSSFGKGKTDDFISKNNIQPNELKILSNPSQLRTAIWLLDQYNGYMLQSIDNNNKIFVSDIIPENVFTNMLLMLKQQKYLYKNDASQNIKLITFGVPNGFSKQMSDRIERDKINSKTFVEKEFDVIKVNLYKRDIRYDDIVFKPKTFLFDLSLYPSEYNLYPTIDPDGKWFDFVQDMYLRDYENPLTKNNVGYFDIESNEKYSFLSSDDKKQLLINHFESIFLNMYISYITGFKLSEDVFTENAVSVNQTYSQQIFDLILNYLSNVKNKDIKNARSVDEILKNQNIDQETKDIITLASYGNILFQPDTMRQKILTQKLFDRVFTLSFDIDNFEIDVDLTKLTQTGRQSFEKASTQNMIVNVQNKTYLKPRDNNELIFDDYFITIETNFNG